MVASVTGRLHLVDENGMGSDSDCQRQVCFGKRWQRDTVRWPGFDDYGCGQGWMAMDSPQEYSSHIGSRIGTLEGSSTAARFDTRARRVGKGSRKDSHQAVDNSSKTQNETRSKGGLYQYEGAGGDHW